MVEEVVQSLLLRQGSRVGRRKGRGTILKVSRSHPDARHAPCACIFVYLFAWRAAPQSRINCKIGGGGVSALQREAEYSRRCWVKIVVGWRGGGGFTESVQEGSELLGILVGLPRVLARPFEVPRFSMRQEG